MPQTVYVVEGLYPLVLLACPIGMGLMMWLMMRGNKQTEQPQPKAGTAETDAEVARLRAEVDQLRSAVRDRETPPTVTTTTPH